VGQEKPGHNTVNSRQVRIDEDRLEQADPGQDKTRKVNKNLILVALY
jgi:hypothetical protein